MLSTWELLGQEACSTNPFFTEKKFNRYRQSDNFKVPFWLQPEKYYTGVAWYQRDIDIPAGWQEKAIRLFFERCHWESRVWIDSVEVGMRNTLSAPQEYDLTGLLTPGKHVITVRVDNMIREIDPGKIRIVFLTIRKETGTV